MAVADLGRPELSSLVRPDGIPLRLLFQRLGERDGPARAHLDLAWVDREARRARHVAAGPEWSRVHDLDRAADPVGRVYCLTDRSRTHARVRGRPRAGQVPPRKAQQGVLDDLGERRVDPVLARGRPRGRSGRSTSPG